MVIIDTSKIIKTDFDASDKFGFPGIGAFVVETIQNYEKNSKIESFVHMHGAIELILFNVWGLFLMNILKEKFKPLEAFWDYKSSITLLHQTNLIDQDTISKLIAFKKGRDTVSHLMTNKFHKKPISDKALDDQFKKGIYGYLDLIKLRKKLIRQIKNH